MAGIPDLEATIARLEAAAADAREATRETHEAIQAAADARRQLRAEAMDVMETLAGDIKGQIERAVRAGLEQFHAATMESIEKAQRAVYRRFDELGNMLITGERNGRTNEESVLAAAARRALAQRQPPPRRRSKRVT